MSSYPDLPVTVVHLAGVKGSKLRLTDFLSKRDEHRMENKARQERFPKRPVAWRQIAAMEMVAKVTSISGAIRYVELTYAKRKDLGYGSVQNAAGQFVKPTSAGIVRLLGQRRINP